MTPHPRSGERRPPLQSLGRSSSSASRFSEPSDEAGMAEDGSNHPYAQSPMVAALKYDAGVGPQPLKHHPMERSFSQDIEAGTQELKQAAEQTKNIILDLGLDGIIRWVSPSWTDVVGTDLEQVKGQQISKFIHDGGEAFQRAIENLKSNDSKSQFVKFSIRAPRTSDLAPMMDCDDTPEGRGSRERTARREDDKTVLQLEGQGIMVYDRATGGESHTMWMMQPPAEQIHIEIELPQSLVDTLGVGAEVLAKYLSELTESGRNDPANHPPPMPVVCRICERSIVPWWFERHSDLCVQEHKAELDVQMIQESLQEHRHAIVRVLDAFESRASRPGSGEGTPVRAAPEYKGLPIGPSPSTSSTTSSTRGSQAASPVRSRSPSNASLGHARTRSSFIVRRPLVRIVELILDLCDTATEIGVPAIKDGKADGDDEFRTQSPQSESRMSQVLQWQQPSSPENEPGLATLALDTERLARSKVEAVHRHQVILEYGERIRQEYLTEVDFCINEALDKAERVAAGELLSSSEGEEDSEGDDRSFPVSAEEVLTLGLEDLTVTTQEPEVTRAQARPQLRSMASALRNPMDMPAISLVDDRRPSSQAVSTGSSSPIECPTPKSHRSHIPQPQPISKRLSIYATTDEGENSDSSLPSSSVLSNAWRTDSPVNSEQGLSRTTTRDRKRRSLHLHGLNSASPHRPESPGRYPPPPASPLRMNKARLSQVDPVTQSPIVSPLLTQGDFSSSPQYHHRRQSSIHSSDLRVPLSPRLTSSAHPQPRAQPPSIKDFEIIKPISKGAFGSVYLSKKKLTGEYFAVKVLRKADMVAKNQVTNVKAERAIMMWQGESDFVAKLYWTFSSKDYLFLVMEYLNGGDCASLVKVLGGLTEDWAKKYVAEVILGVAHLHSRGIVHRDLKPDNLLIDAKGHLKLTDFGLSRMGLIGRQQRALKSHEETAPDLLKQGPFATSGPPSRSASFDYHNVSPSQTPLMTPALGVGLDQPSYFSLNRESSLSRDNSRKASGHRSDNVSLLSHELHQAFSGLGLHDNGEANRPPPVLPRPSLIEEESVSQGSASPDLYPLTQSMSISSIPPTASASQILPPATALFDPEESNRRFVGTPDYLAPETITGTVQDEMCDWWSLGCIVFEFLFGCPPFNAPTTEAVFDNILNRRIAWPDEDEVMVSDEAKDLINQLIQVDPRKRLGANVDERFLNGGAEIQAHPWLADINWTTLLEDEAQFIPNPENPEDTEYFDTRGATLQSFPEEMEDQVSPVAGTPNTGDYPTRPHDALFRARSQMTSTKRGLMPLHIPPHVARDSRSRRLSEPVIADDFGSFTYKNLPVLEKANKDIVEKMRKETMQAQARSSQMVSQSLASSSYNSPVPSAEASPQLPMPVKRALSVSKGHHRSASPASINTANPSPSRGSQPSSPLLVQFATHQHHERRKTSGSSNASNASGLIPSPYFDLARDGAKGSPSSASPIKRMSTVSAPKQGGTGLQPTSSGRTRSQTVGSQESEGPVLREPFVPGHAKRRSQLFMRDVSPSSSDNETQQKALLKVQRKRQCSRRMSQINLLDGPSYRPLDVLICEDHPVSRMVMEKLLEKMRCRTITATTGPEALRFAVSQIQFDIIFTEYKLPLINGVDVARMIRDTKSANSQTPIVCITGYLKDLPELHQFNALLQKPPTTSKLTDALCKHCSWKPPPKDYKPTIPLSIPTNVALHPHLQDSPISVASSRAPTMPDSSYKSSSREDSISSGGFFSDMDSMKTDEVSVIISRAAPDEWNKAGLGISDETVLDPRPFVQSGCSHTAHNGSASPTGNADEVTLFSTRAPRPQRSSDAIRNKRESLEKNRTAGGGGAEEGDDEDEELGRGAARTKSPVNRAARTGSKLGHEMLRTNSRGSVISMHEDRLSDADCLRQSLEILGEQIQGMRIEEESSPFPDLIQAQTTGKVAPSDSSHDTERPPSRGHITPPVTFPPQPGNNVQNFDMDDEATPMPNKTFELEEEPTPKPTTAGSTNPFQQLQDKQIYPPR